METNKWRRPNPRDIRDLCELYETDQETQAVLSQMARESRQRGWWEAEFGDVLGSAFIGFEQEALTAQNNQPLAIPGLLQTPAYIHALARAAQVRDPIELERRVEMRLTRQKILTGENPLRLWVILDEAAISRTFGTVDDQREQLQRLVDTDRMENVTLQILPFSSGMHGGLACGFVILSYEEDPSIVYIETGSSALYLEKPDDLAWHSVRFQHLQAEALGPDASIEFIADKITRLR